MMRICEFVYLPTDVGTIRLDIHTKNSLFYVHAELNELLASSYGRNKVNAVKKAILILAKEHHSFGHQE